MHNIYGSKPVDLGLIDLDPKEMMYWLYCPIKLVGQSLVTVPDNLEQFMKIINAVRCDVGSERWNASYVYITAKTLFVTADNPGNRPGWHSDGFMTSDLNYVWSDTNGTLFWEPEQLVDFVQDHSLSLEEMQKAAETGPVRSYADKHLLKLDQSVIHRVADVTVPRVRSFVKVSVSYDKYDLVGNSINHDLAPNWKYYERKADRNMPSKSEEWSKTA